MLINTLKHRFNDIKLKNKLILMLLTTIILPIALLSFFSFHKMIENADAEVNLNFTSMVNQVTNNLDKILFNLRSNAESIYGDRIIQKALKGEAVLSIDSIEQQNEIIHQKMSANINAATYLFAATGKIYTYNAYFYPDLSMDFRKASEYEKCKRNDYKLVWIPTNHISLRSSVSSENKMDTFGIALILKDLNTREEVGLLEMIIKEEYIFSVFNKVKMTQNAFGFIIDSDGYIISHQDKQLLGKKNTVYPGIPASIFQRDHGSVTCRIGKQEYILYYGTIATNNWKLIFAVPRNEILKYTASTRNLFLVIIIICSVISVLISMLVSQGISKPIEEIVSVIVKYGKGELSERIRGHDDRNDEIGILTKELNHMAERITQLVQKDYYGKIKLKEAELEALQAQINPHFLYNTLDTINFLGRKHHIQEISRIAIALGDLMRISIRKETNLITVREEINYVRNYMTIQEMRFRDKLSLELEVDEDLYDCTLPKLTLQPLVENALIHGIEEKIGKGKIIVSGSREENTLVFKVTDDGIGLDEELVNRMLSSNLAEYMMIKSNGFSAFSGDGDSKRKGSSVGLKNVDMRIKLLFGCEYGISVRSKIGEGTVVSVRIPVSENKVL